MKIRGQSWIETGEHLIIMLREPYWGAWKKYGWEKGVEGMGVSIEAVKEAEEKKKKIMVRLLGRGAYEISPKMALKYAGRFVSRDNKVLLVIPRNKFKRG
jgi:hypothetical protein